MRRRGFTIIEVVLALVLTGGPLLVTMQLVRTATRQAAIAKELTTTRLLMMDHLTVLAGEPVEDLREFSQPGKALLKEVLRARIARMPVTHQRVYASEVEFASNHRECRLEEEAGGIAGLARLTLSATLSDGSKVEVFRLLRPPPRDSVEAGDPIE